MAPGSDRTRFALTGAGLGVLAIGLFASGVPMLGFLGLFVFPLPVALEAARGAWVRAATLVLLAMLAGVFPGGYLYLALGAGLTALVGVPAAVAMRHRSGFGWNVALTTASLFALVLVVVVTRWAELHEASQQYVAVSKAHVESGDANLSIEQATSAVAFFDFLSENAQNLQVGVLFGMALLMATAFVAVMHQVVPAPEGVSRGAFSTTRTPDWLVWLGLALFGVWYYEQQFPSAALRLVSWNAAVALFFVYWFNGLSILVFALRAFAVPTFLGTLLLAGALVLTTQWLGVLGLTDTWWDLRALITRVHERQQTMRESNNDDS